MKLNKETAMMEDPSLQIPKRVKQLPRETVRRIQSEQVIVDMVSAVKELLEFACISSIFLIYIGILWMLDPQRLRFF